MKAKAKLILKSLILVYRSSPGWTLASSVFSIVRSILPFILIWLLKLLVDEITAGAGTGVVTDPGRLVLLIFSVAAVWFADEASNDINGYIRKRQSVKLEEKMHMMIQEKAVSLDLIFFSKPDYYDILSRASGEASWRPNSILTNIISFARGCLLLILMAGLLTSLDWRISVLLVAANIPGIWFRLYYSELLYGFHRKQTPEARKAAYFNWILTGDRPSRELRLFGLGTYFSDLFRKSFSKQKEEEDLILRRRTSAEIVSAFFKAAALLVSVLYMARAAVRTEISLGGLTMFLLAFRQGMVSIRELLAAAGGLYEDSLFIADLFEFLGLKESVKAEEPVAPVGALRKDIVAEGLTFSYPGSGGMAIDNISFSIKKGEIVALVGPNGAGKTTLARLLCRLYDADSGVLNYDGTDVRHMKPEEYRKMFSVIFQDFMLYNLTAGENIRLGDTEAPDSGNKIRKAAAAAGAGGVIESLQGTYDAPIGNLFEESRELSWGEWQKIALARALYRDAPVLILDEPSSALDADTEHEIFSRFREIVKGRTTILISHRFANVSLADRIIVMDRGRIAESGTHLQLMRRGGLYSSMYRKQTERFVK